MFARNDHWGLLALNKVCIVEAASDSQKAECINERIQIFERTTFRDLLMFLDTFDLLTVGFLLYCSNDDVRCLIRFLKIESCFASLYKGCSSRCC